MAESRRYPDTEDTGVGGDPQSGPSTPRWVRVFGIIVIIVVLLFTKGPHRPGRHMMEGSRGGYTPPFIAAEVHAPSGSGLLSLIPAAGGHG